jgi:hypothetical protein
VKDAVRERDGFCCSQCGKTREQQFAEQGHDLEVHRVVPGSLYTLEGCVTLCHDCHVPQPRAPRGTNPPNPNPAVRIRIRLAEIAELRAERLAQDFTQYVNDALRMRLEAEGAWPPPAEPRP